jgi:hypothetical protein
VVERKRKTPREGKSKNETGEGEVEGEAKGR